MTVEMNDEVRAQGVFISRLMKLIDKASIENRGYAIGTAIVQGQPTPVDALVVMGQALAIFAAEFTKDTHGNSSDEIINEVAMFAKIRASEILNIGPVEVSPEVDAMIKTLARKGDIGH